MNERNQSPTSESLDRICEEPFRLFFLTGSALGLVGVSLWLLFYLGVKVDYPNLSHARLMIEGLMASFIFGFLGTAGPRITSTRHLSLGELWTVFTLVLFAAGAHVSEAHRLADLCFLLALLVFATALARRFRERQDTPPPNFVLVALGLLSGMGGTALVAWYEPALYSRGYQIGSRLLNECFVLFPVLGVAPFFIRRLLDLPTPDVPESRALSPQWKKQAAFAGLIGATIWVSLLLEIFGWPGVGGWLRVGAIVAYLAARLPLTGRAALANALRASLAFIVAGFATMAALPLYRVGGLHIVFITGFNLILFSVATRVVFGHSGNLERLQKRLWFFIFTTGLLVLAMVARLSADLSPRTRVPHLISAAICWLIAALIWMVPVIPKIRAIEPE